MARRGLFLLLPAVAAVLAFPVAASGATYCVNKSGFQCNQTFTAGELDAAIAKADADQNSLDRIELGPGIYNGGRYYVNSRTELIGSGIDKTVITNATPTSNPETAILLANYEGETVTDLTVRIGPGEAVRGIQMGGNAVVERVRVVAAPGADPEVGLDAHGVTVRDVHVELPQESSTGGSIGGTIEDSSFEGETGLFLNGGVARRIVAIGNAAMESGGGGSRVEDSVLRSHGPEAIGLIGPRFAGGETELSQVTVAGDGSPGSIGLKAESGSGAFVDLTTGFTVRNTVVSGFATSVTRQGFAGKPSGSCGTQCSITQNFDIAYSAFDFPEGVKDLGGPGSLTLGPGNVDLGDPRFGNPAAGDYRLRPDSPLIDAGDPVALGSNSFYSGEPLVDFGGLERIVDGRAGGSPAARRDIGAYEYARRSPSVTVGSPPQALLYQPVEIPVQASDPDPFDTVSLQFSFDGQAGGTAGSHVFTTLGSHTALVLGTDPTGAAATGSTTFQVKALPGKCANKLSGGGKRDVFKGTSAGDSLSGLGGRDSLRGGDGSDCLFGGKGNDFLEGGKGKDRLAGGAGGDRISSKDHKRDKVDCGPGDDSVVADPVDSLKNCETTPQ